MTPERKLPDEVRHLLNEIAAQRLLSSVPITWDEVEELLPALNRHEAERYLNGQLDDRHRAALFAVLFAWHPGLRALLRPQEVLPKPPTVIVFRPMEQVGSQTGPLQAAAKEATHASETLWLVDDQGHGLKLFPSSRKVGQHVVSFDNGKPAGKVTLCVYGEPLPWCSPVNEKGRGHILSSALADVVNGSAQLEMIIDPADENEEDEVID